MKHIKITTNIENFTIITQTLIKKCIGAGCKNMRDVQELLNARKIIKVG